MQTFYRHPICLPGRGGLDLKGPSKSGCCHALGEGRKQPKLGYAQINPRKRRQLNFYLKLLLEKNEVMNLTAVRTMDEAVERHVKDSLTLIPVIEDHAPDGALRIVDVGSGAGLPGVILAIMKDLWKVVVLDSQRKRCGFVEEAMPKCGVDNVQTLWARAEEAGRMDTHREVYDVAVVRAVAELRVLVEYCLPLLMVGGIMVAAKGPAVEEEIRDAACALKAVGGTLVGIMKVDSFSAEGQRTVVVIKKTESCPERFPRRPGMPSKRPL